jgi:phospho-N-acetylmuramoyl-pentapeptide-transferase
LLSWLGQLLESYWGPFRLLNSHLVLGGIGIGLCSLLTLLLLPRLAEKFCPRDRGRAFAVESGKSQGKPTGAGIIFIPLFLMLMLLIVPFSIEIYVILALTLVACIFGFLDDRATTAWGEYVKGLVDLVVAIIAVIAITGLKPTLIWLPFIGGSFELDAWIYCPIAVVWIWVAINATNCTDGVDGLSGTLSGIAFLSLGSLLYFVLSHKGVASYFLVPQYHDAANYGLLSICLAGTLSGYLWHNAHPSRLLMGDAGSRALGFLLGVIVLKCGNPFLSFAVASVLLVNGGTGLVKVALLRFAKIAIFKNIRFPLHDHVRKSLGPKAGEYPNWSTPQVLVRFSILQLMLTLVIMVLLLKLR